MMNSDGAAEASQLLFGFKCEFSMYQGIVLFNPSVREILGLGLI